MELHTNMRLKQKRIPGRERLVLTGGLRILQLLFHLEQYSQGTLCLQQILLLLLLWLPLHEVITIPYFFYSIYLVL